MQKLNTLNKLLRESTSTTSNQGARPALIGLTRATTNLIYSDLVATQFTSQPVATLYGVRYLTPDENLSFITGATYGGEVGSAERETLEELSLTNKDTFKLGDMFKSNSTVYKVLSEPAFDTTANTIEGLLTFGIIKGTIRFVSEAANTEKFEAANSDTSESRIKIDRWQAKVKSRKLKTELTVELAQDLEANGFDAPELIDDLLATQMAEEVNKDIIQSLVTVSTRLNLPGMDNGILDLSSTSASPEQGRLLYRYVCDMNALIQQSTSYTGTYVLASARVAAVLASSGWLKNPKDGTIPPAAMGILKNGLVVYDDPVSPVDYLIVGVKESYGDNENVASLFYAPFTEGTDGDDDDEIGSFKVIVDPASLQPKVALLLRYALSVNPYTMGLDDAKARVIDSTNLDNFVGQSKMSYIIGVQVPKLV